MCVYHIGKFYVAMKQFAEAEQCWKRVLQYFESGNNSSIVAKAHLQLGKGYEKTARLSDAERVLTYSPTAKSVASGRLHVRLGNLYFRKQSYGDSELEYNKAVSNLESFGAPSEHIAESMMRQALNWCVQRRCEGVHSGSTSCNTPRLCS